MSDIAQRAGQPGASFHMPGHKQGANAHPAFVRLVGEAVFRADLSEIGGVDYLHSPEGALAQAQALAAQAVGAERTFFLVNGSTVGNQAAILSTVRDGQRVLVPRNSHRSVFGALALANAVPEYMVPMVHPLVGIPLALDTQGAAARVKSGPSLAAIHATSPDYYGCCPDLALLAAAAADQRLPFLVDEAHGAHFSFHPDFPPSAVALGADVVVQSVHKTLGSLTQSSFLHWRSGHVSASALEQWLALLQSSSPSVLLTGSLDAARAFMMGDGHALLERAIVLAQQVRERIRTIPPLWCFGSDMVGEGGVAAYDPTKLIVSVADLGISGFEASRWLADEREIEAELSDFTNVVFSITFADTEETIQGLLAGLRALALDQHGPTRGAAPSAIPWPGIPAMRLTLREAQFAAACMVPLVEARGRVAAESVVPYPPGIPVLLPGEEVDQDSIDYLRILLARGARIVGSTDPTLQQLRVIA